MTIVRPEELVARARGLREQLRAEQDEADRVGHYSQALHEAFLDHGFHRILHPTRYGGMELDLETFYRVVVEIATGHPGAGWCFALSASHLWVFASHFPPTTQDEILGTGSDFIAPFSASFNGTCRTAEGGYVVRGDFGYASGAPFSTHLLGVTRVEGTNPPDVRLVLIPREAFEILADWGGDQTLGMRASGSHTVRVAETFVPAGHSIPFRHFLTEPAVRAQPTPGTEWHGSPRHLGPLPVPFHLNLLAVVVGTARAAIDEFTEAVQAKKDRTPPFPLLRDVEPVQSALGEAIAKAATAETALFAVARDFERACARAVDDGEPFTVEENLRQWTIGQQAAELAHEAVRILFANSGTSAGRAGSRIGRYLGDVAMYTTHPVANERRTHPMLGRAHLGVTPGFHDLED